MNYYIFVLYFFWIEWIAGQVLMLQSQLQFERHRREIHAERNRRLLAKAKGFRLVEEELVTLRLHLTQVFYLIQPQFNSNQFNSNESKSK